ncbi:hypothetical protein, conserved [Babesia bigemina]|uniref:Uncharacterized protein n=1 Tax=Babesia bigemina TaxID=5866 RepID=A0A061BKH6_BABBI|nr:hypothetical protein, conserved [Babesia bigemina]CDR71428.1 hypothetical protein, conserved [Babesia bigemina]|eukprot:XP_012770378.1 hypothetical protein, conserved [Babesia bigemina]
MKIVEKLKKFATELGENDNILTHLCDGLEKFLGFNSESKGYTGQGIVYSDLDRLCDGVMGFLSGVLSNIKEHLGQHKDTLNDAIESLNTNKHAGKKGFNDAIAEVVDGVRRYNDAVRDSNKKVSDVITKINNYARKLKSNIGKLEYHEHVASIDKYVNECIRLAAAYSEGMVAEDAHIGDLQDILEDEVRRAKNVIEYNANRIQKIWMQQKSFKDSVISSVEKQLDDSKNTINSSSTESITKFAKGFAEIIEAFKQRIADIDKMLLEYVSQVGQWITKAHDAVSVALGRVNEITHVISGPKAQYKLELVNAVAELKHKSLGLYNAYKASAGKLPKLASMVKDALADLDGKVQKDLAELRHGIGSVVSQYVQMARKHFEVIKEKTLGEQGDGNGGINKYWGQLEDGIWNLIEGIYAKNPGKSGLTAIIQGVATYAEKFTKQNFGNDILDAWIASLYLRMKPSTGD